MFRFCCQEAACERIEATAKKSHSGIWMFVLEMLKAVKRVLVS